jgi:predicted nucleotidyltransferase
MHPVVEQKLPALLDLCRRSRLRRLDLFGSAASGTFVPGTSDLDFLVELEDLAPAEYSEAYFSLLEGLEDLFGLPIDLVVESAVTNPYFRESFERTRVRLYAA